MAKEKIGIKNKKEEKTSSVLEDEQTIKTTKLVYIGPNIYSKGLVHGKVFDYEPKHLIKSMPEIKHILISTLEFTKNKAQINKQGSKYDFLIKEFQASLIK